METETKHFPHLHETFKTVRQYWEEENVAAVVTWDFWNRSAGNDGPPKEMQNYSLLSIYGIPKMVKNPVRAEMETWVSSTVLSWREVTHMYRCGLCSKLGHNRRRCGKTSAPVRAKPALPGQTTIAPARHEPSGMRETFTAF